MQLSQWLRLAAFWGPGSRIFPSHVTQWTSQGVLCRVYICASLGVLEPLFLTTVVLLCRGPLRCRTTSLECRQSLRPSFLGRGRRAGQTWLSAACLHCSLAKPRGVYR